MHRHSAAQEMLRAACPHSVQGCAGAAPPQRCCCSCTQHLPLLGRICVLSPSPRHHGGLVLLCLCMRAAPCCSPSSCCHLLLLLHLLRPYPQPYLVLRGLRECCRSAGVGRMEVVLYQDWLCLAVIQIGADGDRRAVDVLTVWGSVSPHCQPPLGTICANGLGRRAVAASSARVQSGVQGSPGHPEA